VGELNAPWIERALGWCNPNGICMEAESNAYALDSTFLDCLRVLEEPGFLQTL
jgi:hypothetical protein